MMTYNLPNLNESVLSALDFFSQNKPTKLKINNLPLCLVVGSVNAYHTGQILFSGRPVLFADEGSFRKILETYRPLIKNKTIREAIIISASGEKDSIWEIKEAKKNGLKTTLLTCSPDSTGAKLADYHISFKKYPEPYSYNFSTYFGMIISQTAEKPQTIKKIIKKIKIITNLKKYSFFTFILPDQFKPIVNMLNVKDDELFGPHSSLRAYTEGEARHAKFICQSPKELVISLGKNSYFGLPKNRWQITLPKNSNFGLILSLSYYLVGLIQKNQPAYFKKGIKDYCLKTGPKPYGRNKPFPIIVS